MTKTVLTHDPARLRAARTAAKFTQIELAERVGMDQASISNLERGRVGASVTTLRELARALNVSLKYLMGNQETAPDPETIANDSEMPPGLRELASMSELMSALKILPAEWRLLVMIATAWQDADLVRRDGWIQVLIALRTAATSTD